MNSKVKAIIALAAVLVFSATACTASAQTINSAADLKTYLDRQPANSPDKPIRVTMNANAPMLESVAAAINSAGKYVSLNLSGNILTAIPDGAFAYNKMLVSVTIPNSVTSIEWCAFEGCTGLTSVTIPDNVTSIRDGAFIKCTGLTSVIIGNGVTSIGESAFENCTGLTSVTIGNRVISIGPWAFLACRSLASITIGNSVTKIERGAFSECTSLASITISNSVKIIEKWAFSDCTGLTSVKFEGTITSGDFDSDKTFPGDLRAKYLAGGIGTYTRPSGGNTWTKQ